MIARKIRFVSLTIPFCCAKIIRLNKNLSRCSAVGSAQRSGRWGREFESLHFDQKEKSRKRLFLFVLFSLHFSFFTFFYPLCDFSREEIRKKREKKMNIVIKWCTFSRSYLTLRTFWSLFRKKKSRASGFFFLYSSLFTFHSSIFSKHRATLPEKR